MRVNLPASRDLPPATSGTKGGKLFVIGGVRGERKRAVIRSDRAAETGLGTADESREGRDRHRAVGSTGEMDT